MNTVKFESKEKIKMIAHRGLSGLERENTCAAFVAAGVKSYYGIETDVHVTKDKKYIIIHNDDLKHITGQDVAISETNYDDLRRLRLKDVDDETERADLFLPSLDEYLSICKKYKKQAVLELKGEMSEEDVAGIAGVVEEMGLIDNITFISFNKNSLLRLRKAYPNVSAQFISDEPSPDTVKFVLENNLDADIYYEYVTKEFINLMHENGRVVNVWTVDTVAEAEQVKALGVDMITSDILE